MLRISALTLAQQRELRRWQVGGDQHLARRAQVVLWSARGWSVPALAHVLGCCRRTVRRSTADSASGSDPPATDDRLVPVVPISAPELRRILAFHWHRDPVSPEFFWHWSTWRRYKQALAMRSHYQKRGAVPPDFEYLRL